MISFRSLLSVSTRAVQDSTRSQEFIYLYIQICLISGLWRCQQISPSQFFSESVLITFFSKDLVHQSAIVFAKFLIFDTKEKYFLPFCFLVLLNFLLSRKRKVHQRKDRIFIMFAQQYFLSNCWPWHIRYFLLPDSWIISSAKIMLLIVMGRRFLRNLSWFPLR